MIDLLLHALAIFAEGMAAGVVLTLWVLRRRDRRRWETWAESYRQGQKEDP